MVSLLSESPTACFKALLSSGLLIATSVVINDSVVAILGPIIPAPLIVPAIVTSQPDTVSFRTACLGLVSVVIIALAKSSPAEAEAESFATAFGIPAVIFLIGSTAAAAAQL